MGFATAKYTASEWYPGLVVWEITLDWKPLYWLSRAARAAPCLNQPQ
jgi:hypothetical protein